MGGALREFIESIIESLEASAGRLVKTLTCLMAKCFIGFVASALVVAGLVWLLLR